MTGLLADESDGSGGARARRVLAACAEGDMLRTQLAILRRLAQVTPRIRSRLSRKIAGHCIQAERYPF